jgi:hypothetical protein
MMTSHYTLELRCTKPGLISVLDRLDGLGDSDCTMWKIQALGDGGSQEAAAANPPAPPHGTARERKLCNYSRLVDRCLQRGHALNDWDLSFLSSIKKALQAGTTLTFRQRNKLFEVAGKVWAPEAQGRG